MNAIIDAMLDQSFRTWGKDVTYSPTVGDDFTLRVVPAQEDVAEIIGLTQIKSDAALFEARAASFSATPIKGETITDGSEVFTVKDFHRPDPERLIYILECYPTS